MWPIAFEQVAFEKAILWFRDKLAMPRSEWDALTERARRKAFTVSGVAELDVLADVWKAIDKAVAEGTTLKAFKDDVGAKLTAAWAGSVKTPAWRMETIFRTNVQLAYSAGRWRQLQDPAIKESHPFLSFDAVLDDRNTVICRACNGTTLPAEHPFWTSHIPPLHFNCRSAVVPFTDEAAEAAGITAEPTTQHAQAGFGFEPSLDEWAPDLAKYPAPLREAFQRKRAVSPAAVEAPPPPTRSQAILREKLEGAKGSNEGGVYLGADGVRRYVKFYADPAQAQGEHLANRLYRDLGFEAPESELFEHEGKLAYASVIVDRTTTLGKAGLTEERAKRVVEGFAADVLTGNWDAVGLTLDNVLLLEDGRPLRVDNGGTFLFRAKAGRKPASLLNDVTEWDRLRDASVNPAYASVVKAAGGVSDAALKSVAVRGIKAILALRGQHASWAAYVAGVVPDLQGADRDAIVSMLEARTAKLEEKLKLLTKRAPRKKKETRPADVVLDVTSDDGKKLLGWVERLRSRGMSEAYESLFTRSGLGSDDVRTLRSNIGSWVGEYRFGSKHGELYKAFAALNEQSSSTSRESETVQHLARVRSTRKERWRLAMAEAGLAGPVPTHLLVHRGVSGLEWVKDVARAWADEESEHVTMRSHELASWSFSAETGRRFARSKDSNNHTLFTQRVPIESVVYDQIADDAAFAQSFWTEHEVMTGPGHEQGQPIPKRNVTVTYNGKKYGFARRNALLEAMRKDGNLT